jgi:hypothetical protein
MLKKAKTLLEGFRDPELAGEWKDKEEQKRDRLERQKYQLTKEVKILFKEVIDKLEVYYTMDECLSDDKFLSPEKPFLVRALLLSVIKDRTLGSPETKPPEDID